ncbi:MAG: diguanylate cyclase [Fibromonadales bacterium]|nr:diguanylate cyclase [Fibromonadales bacterium]
MELDKNFTVLAVSDNYASLDILNSVLSSYYTVQMAASMEEAMIRMRSVEVNLIILDFVSYSKECHDFLTTMKSAEETMRIPIIIMGDSSSPECEEQAFALGVADYIGKPIRSSIVKVRVNNQRLLLKQIKAIEELGLQDPLTGIANRRGFDNRIHLEWLRAMRDKTNLSLSIADIDYFKIYNDDYGHVQGDVLLRSLAKQFVSMLRRPADFVARWGGEEFVIMLPNTNLKGAVQHSEDIRKSVHKMVIPNLPAATVSIGVASIVPTINFSIEDFFTMADKALYQAKNSGRNKVCCFT